MTSEPSVPSAHAAVPPWRDVRVLRVVAQIVAVLVVGAIIAFLVGNLVTAMGQRGLSLGFGFLGTTAGFEIAETPIPYTATDSYGRAFLVGLLNTMFVSVAGIILATILGLVVGVARLSGNWLVNRTAAGYVELIRNTPLLVQLVLIYAVLLQLPSVANAINVGGTVFLSQRGLFLPAPLRTSTFFAWLAFVVAGVIAVFVLRRIARRRVDAGLGARGFGWLQLAAIVALPVIGWLVLPQAPVLLDRPVQERFNFVGGMALSPEFTALLVGLVVYTAGFIGEVVRGGVQSVRLGQLEAARSLGLSEGETLRLVVFPQALRVIVPPLTSQYLNLAKNSSLAVAIGYPDLFNVSRTVASQTGQPVSVIVLVMATYLAISLATSLLMNIYNRRVQVIER